MGCKGKVAVRLTQDHKPGDPEEIKRIEVKIGLWSTIVLIIKELGGFVKITKTARVQGMLAVSRALGDKKFVPYVSSDPSVTQVPSFRFSSNPADKNFGRYTLPCFGLRWYLGRSVGSRSSRSKALFHSF